MGCPKVMCTLEFSLLAFVCTSFAAMYRVLYLCDSKLFASIPGVRMISFLVILLFCLGSLL